MGGGQFHPLICLGGNHYNHHDDYPAPPWAYPQKISPLIFEQRRLNAAAALKYLTFETN